MQENEHNAAKEGTASPRRFGCFHLFLVALIAAAATAVVGFFAFKAILFPKLS